MEQLTFLLLGIAAGILSGLFGIGGGIVIVPSLIAIFGMDILNANATSLAAMLLPVGIFGVIAYYKAGMINIKESLLISLGLFAGSFVGGELAVNLSENILAKLYAGFLLYIAFSYLNVYSTISKLVQKNIVKKDFKNNGSTESIQHKTIKGSVLIYILVGVAAGIFAGMFGKGGGIIIVPILISIFHYDGKNAVATSLAALQLPVGLPSIFIYAEQGYLNIVAAAFIALGIVIGALVGSKIGIKIPSTIFKKIFAFFLLLMALYMIKGYI